MARERTSLRSPQSVAELEFPPAAGPGGVRVCCRSGARSIMVGYSGELEHLRGLGPGQAMPDHAGNGADWPAAPMRSAIPLGPAGDVQPIVVPAGRDQARRLIAAANELLALAAELEQGAAPAPAGDVYVPSTEFAPEDDGRWLRLARHTYRRRRSRILFFEESLFGEPAWDLLLDLFIAAKERKRVPVTSACIGAAVPHNGPALACLAGRPRTSGPRSRSDRRPPDLRAPHRRSLCQDGRLLRPRRRWRER